MDSHESVNDQIQTQINEEVEQIKNYTPWPESASELHRPPLVGEVSANFCG
jgi:hypothetical protein